MKTHKTFASFFFDNWYLWLAFSALWGFLVHLFWPEVSGWQVFWLCVNMRLVYRAFDTLDELWRRTERLMEKQ